MPHGEMYERFKLPPWKGGTEFTLSRVRIPLSPPKVCFKQYHQVAKTQVNTSNTASLAYQAVA